MKELIYKLISKKNFKDAPLLTLIGQVSKGEIKKVDDFDFGQTGTSTRNTCQIVQLPFSVDVSKVKKLKLKNIFIFIAKAMNKLCFHSIFRESTSSFIAASMHGIFEYLKLSEDTTKIDAKGGVLELKFLRDLFFNVDKKVKYNLNKNIPVLVLNQRQEQVLRKLYDLINYDFVMGNSETASNKIFPYRALNQKKIGELKINTIFTECGEVGFIVDDNMPNDKILLLSMKDIKVTACPVPGKGMLFKEELATNSNDYKLYHIYGQLSIDWGSASNHGLIENLKVE
jgi:hypothetical protein